jgi:hypothetical protein
VCTCTISKFEKPEYLCRLSLNNVFYNYVSFLYSFQKPLMKDIMCMCAKNHIKNENTVMMSYNNNKKMSSIIFLLR